MSAEDLRAQHLASAAFMKRAARHGDWYWAHISVGGNAAHLAVLNATDKRLGCTCFYRSRPCIHARALSIWLSREGEKGFVFSEGIPPEVKSALEGKQVSKTDGATQVLKRKRERLERTAWGIEELHVWMDDLGQRGLATTLNEQAGFFEQMSTRMADASLTAISRRLRLLDQYYRQQPEWSEVVLQELSDIWLLVRAFQRRDDLPEKLLDDLEQALGISMRRKDVLEKGLSLADEWMVMGTTEETLEQSLRSRRTWLYGKQHQRYALLNEFAFNEPFPIPFPAGGVAAGTLAFYPSSLPLRAIFKDDVRILDGRVDHMNGAQSIPECRTGFAAHIAQIPWLERVPCALQSVIPVKAGAQWHLKDGGGQTLSIKGVADQHWKLLAISSGRPIDVFGEWNGTAFRPISALADGRFVAL